jgi:hypothetical protein
VLLLWQWLHGVLVPLGTVVDRMGEVGASPVHARVGNTEVEAFFGDHLWRVEPSPVPVPLLVRISSQSLQTVSLGTVSSPQLNVLDAMDALDGRFLGLCLPSERQGEVNRDRDREGLERETHFPRVRTRVHSSLFSTSGVNVKGVV